VSDAFFAQLSQANRLLADGQTAQAAPLFVELAGTMQASGHPRRAANLHARAAHAFADATSLPGHDDLALEQARVALRLFKQFAMAQRFGQFYGNIGRKFQARGMTAAATALQGEFGAPPQPAQAPAQPAARLPGSCPKCGAPVRSDEVDWVDPHSAECPYCGTVLRAE